jgi:hypothetical protein
MREGAVAGRAAGGRARMPSADAGEGRAAMVAGVGAAEDATPGRWETGRGGCKVQGGRGVSYGPPWAHYLGGYQDRLLGGPLGLLGLCHTAPDDVGRKDYGGDVLG